MQGQQLAAPMAQAPVASSHRPRSQVAAWLNQPPSQLFWGALRDAQADVQPMVKGEEFPDKKGKHFSRTEDWIKAGRDYLLKKGLLGSQAGATLEDGAGGPVLSTQFLVVSTADGTGLLCTVEWPVYGFGGGKGSPGHGTAAAFTGCWKYWIRGLLAIPQVDEGEEFEARDGSVDSWDAKKKNEQAAAAAARNLPQQTQQHERQHSPPPHEPWKQPVPTQPTPTLSQDGRWRWEGGQWVPNNQELVWPSPAQETGPPPWPGNQSHANGPWGSYQRPEFGPRTGQLPPQPQGPTSEAIQRDSQLLGAQFPPGQQAQRPPVSQEPIVQHAQQAFGSEPIPQTHQAPPQRPAPRDGGPDPTYDQLVGVGWKADFARHLAAIGPNDEIPPEMRDEFLNTVNEYFAGDMNVALAAWAGCGYTPQGQNGPKPTGAQLRRYALKLNWNNRAAAAAGR